MSVFAIANILQNARDGKTFAITNIPYEHHEIHEGNHYFVEGNSTMSDTQEYYMKMTTPNTLVEAHALIDFNAPGAVKFEAWEAATGGMAGGSVTTGINSNRNSTKAATVVFTAGLTSTATAVGTKMMDQRQGILSGVGVNKASAGAAYNRENEVILKKNSTYFMKVESGSTGNVFNYHISWYEHTPLTGLKVAD